jgi:glutamine amidotransferase
MSSQRIAIIDYGMGNLHSAASALAHVGPDVDVCVTSDESVIRSADRIMFPGVGAIRDCINEIRRLGFDKLLLEQVNEKPVLAICVGMQAMMEWSDENGGTECLGLFEGKVNFFGALHEQDGISGLNVPHMGWNQVHQASHPMWQDIPQDSRFYFVHSYAVPLKPDGQTVGITTYGVDFASALYRPNLFATQFHPEKSHTNGLQLLKNFLNWNGNC